VPTAGGDIASVVLGIVRVGILGGILAAVLISVILMLDAYAQKLSLRLTTARPRWQYALLALGYGGITSIGVLTGMHYRSGWLVNVSGLFAIWSAAITLAMLGRTVCWGRVRRACWWHRPQWLGYEAVGATR
jgi:hypothetical protein